MSNVIEAETKFIRTEQSPLGSSETTEVESSTPFGRLIESVFKFRWNLDQSIGSFLTDPASTDYQKGYLAALIETRNDLINTVEG